MQDTVSAHLRAPRSAVVPRRKHARRLLDLLRHEQLLHNKQLAHRHARRLRGRHAGNRSGARVVAAVRRARTGNATEDGRRGQRRRLVQRGERKVGALFHAVHPYRIRRLKRVRNNRDEVEHARPLVLVVRDPVRARPVRRRVPPEYFKVNLIKAGAHAVLDVVAWVHLEPNLVRIFVVIRLERRGREARAPEQRGDRVPRELDGVRQEAVDGELEREEEASRRGSVERAEKARCAGLHRHVPLRLPGCVVVVQIDPHHLPRRVRLAHGRSGRVRPKGTPRLHTRSAGIENDVRRTQPQVALLECDGRRQHAPRRLCNAGEVQGEQRDEDDGRRSEMPRSRHGSY
eukprot:Opistho-1_new@73708